MPIENFTAKEKAGLKPGLYKAASTKQYQGTKG